MLCILADVNGAAALELMPGRVLEDLRALHRMAPRASIEVVELEELEGLDRFGRSGVPCSTWIGWHWRPRLHRLAKANGERAAARAPRRG